MSADEIVVSRAQLERLVAELRRTGLQDSSADCISDEEVLDLIFEDLAPERRDVIDEHIGGCGRCADRIGEILDAAEAWRGETGERRLAALRLRVRKDLDQALEGGGFKERLMEWHDGMVAGWRAHLESFTRSLSTFRPALGSAYSQVQEPIDCQSEDATHAAYAAIEANGELVVRVDSRATELEGTDLAVSAGDWHVVVPLARVAPNAVGAEVRIPQAVRESLSAGARLQVTGKNVDGPTL